MQYSGMPIGVSSKLEAVCTVPIPLKIDEFWCIQWILSSYYPCGVQVVFTSEIVLRTKKKKLMQRRKLQRLRKSAMMRSVAWTPRRMWSQKLQGRGGGRCADGAQKIRFPRRRLPAMTQFPPKRQEADLKNPCKQNRQL